MCQPYQSEEKKFSGSCVIPNKAKSKPVAESCANPNNNKIPLFGVVLSSPLYYSLLHLNTREEQDLLEILDLELLGVKTLVSILIDPSLATVVLLDYCLV